MVWVHGFHLLLLPSFLTRVLRTARVGLFLHTPFPSSEIFRTLPFREDLLRGMLNADQVSIWIHDVFITKKNRCMNVFCSPCFFSVFFSWLSCVCFFFLICSCCVCFLCCTRYVLRMICWFVTVFMVYHLPFLLLLLVFASLLCLFVCFKLNQNQKKISFRNV